MSSDRTRKHSVPSCLDPRRLEPSVTPLPTDRWGINPDCAHTPPAFAERHRYGTPLRDSFPVPPLVVPLRLSAQGQGAGTGVGWRWRGWTRLGLKGGGASPIHFRTVRGSSLSLVSPCRLLLPNRRLTSCVFLRVRLHKRGAGCVVLASKLATRALLQVWRTLKRARCHHYRRCSANLHIGL